jgi:receptor protein-tyrosine kinase
MVEDWRDNFEFVVIDTAPVKQFSDALAVASFVGRVLTLSRAQHTPYKDMQDMLRRLAATRSQILGAVISHF